MRKWLAIAAGWAAAAFLLLLGQRNKAREKARQALHQADAAEAIRDTERRVSKAQNKAREANRDAEQERTSRPDDRRPSGEFGRLHNDKD